MKVHGVAKGLETRKEAIPPICGRTGVPAAATQSGLRTRASAGHLRRRPPSAPSTPADLASFEKLFAFKTELERMTSPAAPDTRGAPSSGRCPGFVRHLVGQRRHQPRRRPGSGAGHRGHAGMVGFSRASIRPPLRDPRRSRLPTMARTLGGEAERIRGNRPPAVESAKSLTSTLTPAWAREHLESAIEERRCSLPRWKRSSP